MDVVISQYDRLYIESLVRYNKALQQRNSLLKQETEPDTTLLELLEMQMAEYGTEIYNKRATFIKQLIPVFQSIYQQYRKTENRFYYNMYRMENEEICSMLYSAIEQKIE